MKTLTEFAGVILRQAAQVRGEKAAAGLTGDELIAAVASTLSIAEDRASRLLEALEVAGADKLDQVRLVRVYQGEAPRAKTVGEFSYVVDRLGKLRSPRPDGDRPGRKGGRDRRPPKRGRPGGDGGDSRRSRGQGQERGGRGGTGGRGGPPERSRRRNRDERGEGGRDKLPSSGSGWALTRAPRDGGEPRRRGPGRSQPKRDDEHSRSRRTSRPRTRSKPRQATAPEVARPEVARPEVARPKVARPEVARPEVARPEVARPEATASSPDGLVQRRPSTRPDRPGKRRSRPKRPQQPRPAGVDPGNQAPPEQEEPNGNVAPPISDIDDDFGNR